MSVQHTCLAGRRAKKSTIANEAGARVPRAPPGLSSFGSEKLYIIFGAVDTGNRAPSPTVQVLFD